MARRPALALLLATLALAASSWAHAAVDQCPVLPTGHATLNGSVKAEAGGTPVISQVIATAELADGSPHSVTVPVLDLVNGTFSMQVPAPATYVVSVAPLDQVHAPEFYDGVLTNAAATDFPVTDGQVVNGIDFTVVVGATMSGNVTAEGSGDPLQGVGVAATSLGELRGFAAAQTDASGDYTISGLAPGTYQVLFVPTSGDFLFEAYNNEPSLPGDTVDVSPPGVAGIDAALAIGGRIEGKVTGSSNQALSTVGVSTIGATYGFGAAATDAGGNYSILVPEGTYNVFVVAPTDHISEFYDDKPDLASADPVNVTATQTTSGIDVQLAASGHITGTVTDAVTHDAIEGVTVTAFDATDARVAVAVTGPTGAYDISTDLATGQYKVGFERPELTFDGLPGYLPAFYSNKSTLGTATPVSVTAPGTTSGIDQELVRCGTATTTTLGGTTTTLGATTTTSPVTTTSVPGTTTTTVPSGAICGDPAAPIGITALGAGETLTPTESGPRSITASDALFILRAAVGSQTCELCVCDVNNTSSITASDALIVLRRAVGQPVELTCPACA